MGSALHATAESLACSERTLRRYINEGLLRGRRLDGFRFELPQQEARYAQDHWALLHGLRAALRTERDVRLAVLFGSAATGEDTDSSDIDLLIAHRRGPGGPVTGLRRRLSDALGRRVHLVELDEAHRSPNLFADGLLEGRVIVDRDRVWPVLQSRRGRLLQRAAREDAEALELARAAVDAARERLSE
jgi:predicted nucleotidyltransferase